MLSARFLLNPWFLALAAGAVAALAIWWGMLQRDARRDAEAALRGQEKVIEALNTYAVEVQGIQQTLRDGMEALANVPETSTCSGSLEPVLRVLRDRATP